MSNSPLATLQVPAHSNNYTRGRGGKAIDKIVMHHMAGVCSAYTCGTFFQNPDRKGSTHYGIGPEGEIAQYVDESNTAWANSNWNANQTAVSFETANSSRGGQWPVSDATLESVIKLVADIANRNNLGTLIRSKNFFIHQDYTSTACPGPYLISKIDEIIIRANNILVNGNSTPPTDIDPSKYYPKNFSSKYSQTQDYEYKGVKFSRESELYDYLKLLKLKGSSESEIGSEYKRNVVTYTQTNTINWDKVNQKETYSYGTVEETKSSETVMIDTNRLNSSSFEEEEYTFTPATSLILENTLTKEETENE